jgi:hypothetical protein
VAAARGLVGDDAAVGSAGRPEVRAALLVALIVVNAAFLPLLARTSGNSAGDRDAQVGIEALVLAQGTWWEPHLTLARLAPGATYRLEGGPLAARMRVDRQFWPPLLVLVGGAAGWEYGDDASELVLPDDAPREIELRCTARSCLLLLSDSPPTLIRVTTRPDGVVVLVDDRLVGTDR